MLDVKVGRFRRWTVSEFDGFTLTGGRGLGGCPTERAMSDFRRRGRAFQLRILQFHPKGLIRSALSITGGFVQPRGSLLSHRPPLSTVEHISYLVGRVCMRGGVGRRKGGGRAASSRESKADETPRCMPHSLQAERAKRARNGRSRVSAAGVRRSATWRRLRPDGRRS